MPKTLMHDAGRGAELKRRVQALTPDTKQRWGKMSVDQMLHHVNFVLAEALGEHKAKPNIRGLPKPLVRWAILNASVGERRADATGHARFRKESATTSRGRRNAVYR